MHNLLRMDIYQLRTSKSWRRSLLGIGIFALIYSLFFVICLDEDINAWFLDKGMMFSMNFKGEFSLSLLGVYQKFLSSGVFIGVLLIVYGNHVYAEYQNGFIKNIGAAYIDNKQYMISKMIKASIMSLGYILVSFFVILIVCSFFPDLFQMETYSDIFFFLMMNWLLTTCLCSFILAFLLCFRNKTLIIIYAVLLGSSVWTMLEQLLLSIFHVEEWITYDAYYRILVCPLSLTWEYAFPVVFQSIIFLVICGGIGYTAFVKKDMA